MGGVTIKDLVLDEPLRVFPGHRGGGVTIKDPTLDESRILRGAYHFACALSWGGVTIKDLVLDEPLRAFPGHRGGGGV